MTKDKETTRRIR
ncbi:95e65889-092f-4ad1-89bd-fa1041a8575d [Thermothielavioides terrestris]|uniref:95e65889-092f-4ad1-89bd-fa1041a8575d n=1 Tax=Thermothielavioides terrestris TaxID=2587410 RepID=A0A446BGU9_9PEZI|nr:95e65889-092f-4ad1-89bd-fa1041a8575d [Thermothielavioides terrestris]